MSSAPDHRPLTIVGLMDIDTAIRTRRTHKAYRPEPVPRETLEELLELARWAPTTTSRIHGGFGSSVPRPGSG